MNDCGFANPLCLRTEPARDPAIQDTMRVLNSFKARKPEWGRPLNEYVQDLISPDYNAPMIEKRLVQDAIISMQMGNWETSRPTCKTFKSILGLLQDPINLPMLKKTTILSTCIYLLREHIEDTQEPMFCYEYGYLCFQLMAFVVQAVILTRDRGDGFKNFVKTARGFSRNRYPALLVFHTILQLEADELSFTDDELVRTYEFMSTAHRGRTSLPSAGGMTDLDATFLIRALWKARKELSYIGSKVIIAGWSFLVQMLSFHLLHDVETRRMEPVLWGYLDAVCIRYGLVANAQEEGSVFDICGGVKSLCPDMNVIAYAHRMVDEEDARIIAESYITRMACHREEKPLPLFFCANLIDFVFKQEISELGETLFPLISVGFERAWSELADERVTRDVEWSTNMSRFCRSILRTAECLLGAEHLSDEIKMEAFVQPLHDIDLIGFLGQIILLPMVLVSDREIDGYWSNFIKSVVSFAETLAYCKASKLLAERFTNEYYTWLNTLTFVRRQVLNNPGGDESLRANAPGAEIAWMSVGKVFDFTTHTRTDDASQEPVRANGCTNLRCPGVTEYMAVCGRCTKARYCSRVCQDTHWGLETDDAHRDLCALEGQVFSY